MDDKNCHTPIEKHARAIKRIERDKTYTKLEKYYFQEREKDHET